MARRPVIDREELFQAANAMSAEGRPVTAIALLEALGGGSYRTIYKYLGEWEGVRQKSETVVNTAEIPESVLNALTNTWRVATMEASKEVLAVKAKAAEEVAAAESRFEDAMDAIQKFEARSEEDAEQIEMLKAKVTQLEQLASQLGNENSALKATAEQLQQQVTSQQTELERVHKDHEQERTQFGDRVERLNLEIASVHNKTEKRVDELQSSLDAANKEREQASKEAAEYRGRIDALTEQFAQLISTLGDEKTKNKP